VLSFPPSTKTFMASKRVDGRKGINGLTAIIRSQFKHELFDGHVYVFITKRADGIRVIFWDRSGYLLVLKRLEKGTFHMPWDECEGPPRVIESAELMLLLEGIDLRGAKRRGRWNPRTRVT